MSKLQEVTFNKILQNLHHFFIHVSQNNFAYPSLTLEKTCHNRTVYKTTTILINQASSLWPFL
jgi:hypothetical protein